MKNTVLLLLIFSISASFAQVGINTATPHVSAELDVSSASRGLLVPRLTTTAVNTLSATASEGLIVFDTTRKMFLGFDGTTWQVLGNSPIQITFASWEVFGFTNSGISPLPATVTNQITSAILQRGSGLGTGGAGDAWGGNNFDNLDLASAVTGGDFATITITLPSSAVFSFGKIAANNLRRSATGAAIVQWQYSTDGTTFIDIGSAINLPISTAVGNNIPEIALSSISALQSLINTVVTFRLVGYGGTGGTGYFNDIPGKDLEIIGTYN
jgi:hypothetical protein